MSQGSHFLLCPFSPSPWELTSSGLLSYSQTSRSGEERTAISFKLYCVTIYNFTLVTGPLGGSVHHSGCLTDNTGRRTVKAGAGPCRPVTGTFQVSEGHASAGLPSKEQTSTLPVFSCQDIPIYHHHQFMPHHLKMSELQHRI